MLMVITVESLMHACMPQNTDEASSSAPCILRGLVDVANTPLCEPTTSLHDDILPFDRGK